MAEGKKGGIVERVTWSKYLEAVVAPKGPPWVKARKYAGCSIPLQKFRVRATVKRSEFAKEFFEGLTKFHDKLNQYERIDVHFWYYPFVYIDVIDTRWKHYPCGHRAYVSFDLTNGKWASEKSENRYSFARKGWGRFMDEFVGYTVSRYSDCGNPEKTTFC